MKYWIVTGIVIFVVVVWILYHIGKAVKNEEAKIQSQVKKQFVDAKKKNRFLKYARKSTPKVPAINGRRKNTRTNTKL